MFEHIFEVCIEGGIAMRFSMNTNKKQNKSYIAVLFLIALLLGMCIGWFLGKGQVVSAESTAAGEISNKYYTSVRIEPGDTLWTIAEKYRTKEYSDMNLYIKEIKECNGLYSDKITEGCYLLIPYYSNMPFDEEINSDDFRKYE